MVNNFEKYKNVKSNLLVGDVSRKTPEITFLVPTYRRPILLKRALYSILNQKTSHSYDIVVVDNESETNTATEQMIRELAADYEKIYYYKNEENIGMFGNWNRCYELARSEWCSILMDDDEIADTYLNRVLETRDRYHLDCVRVGSQILDQNNKKIEEKGYLDEKYLNRPNHVERIMGKYFLYRGALPPSGMCIRKSIVYELGGYKEEYYPASDFEFDSRLVKDHQVALLWERLCITHTEDSASMKKETIIKSIRIGHDLYQRVYEDYFGKDNRYTWIYNVRTYIAIEKNGLNNGELSDVQLKKKYCTRAYILCFKILYRLHRVCQTIAL